jgi:hypothetical protein
MNRFNSFDTNKLTLLPPFDHKEAADDDCGLPEHPIFSNYVKYLWKGHTRTGGVERPRTPSGAPRAQILPHEPFP